MYKEMKAEDIVFEYKSIGDLFFIILKGTVKIFVPKKDKIEQLEKANRGMANRYL